MATLLRVAPPQRQTVYYTHTGRTVVATHELYLQRGDLIFIRPMLPLIDAVRALAPSGDTENRAHISVGKKVRRINEPCSTDLRLVMHSGPRSRGATERYVMVTGMEVLLEIIYDGAEVEHQKRLFRATWAQCAHTAPLPASAVTAPSPPGHERGADNAAAAGSKRPAPDDLDRVDTVPIRDDVQLQYTTADGGVDTRSIEDEILAGGKRVPNPLAGPDGTIPAAIAEKHTRLNPERPMAHGRHVAGEAVSAQVFGSYLVNACHLIVSAREQGWGDHNGPDWDRDDALNFLKLKLQTERRVLIRPRGDLYLHRSRTPGQAQFIARMRPVAVVLSKTVYENLPADERESHWLATKVARKRAGKQQMVPVWEVYPYLIVGCGPWDADVFVREKLRGIHATHGKHGAAGTVFHIYVDTFD
jgi:hypothetical protein